MILRLKDPDDGQGAPINIYCDLLLVLLPHDCAKSVEPYPTMKLFITLQWSSSLNNICGIVVLIIAPQTLL